MLHIYATQPMLHILVSLINKVNYPFINIIALNPMGAKKVEKKTTKEIKKEIEDKSFGMKNKKNSRELKKAFTKLSVQPKKEEAERIVLVQPRAPIGVDPKTITCVYFINKMCDKGDKCKYGHEKPRVQVVEAKHETTTLVCRFMIDAINEGQFSKNWICPNPKCMDIHKLSETTNVEISIEEFIELKRQNIENETLITEELFNAWKRKKRIEDEKHRAAVKALREGVCGTDLFKETPNMFVDDEEALDVDYNERNYENEESVEVEVQEAA